MELEYKVEGLESLLRKLNTLGTDVDEIVDNALYQGAQKIQGDAKRLIKAKDAFDTGRLHGSIKVDRVPNGYSIGTSLKYAHYIEYGTGPLGDPTVPHTTRKYWRYKDENGNWHTSHGMKARPYLRPALNINKKYVAKLVRSRLLNVLRQKMSGG
jgi:HK97 gp10 family phage protein